MDCNPIPERSNCAHRSHAWTRQITAPNGHRSDGKGSETESLFLTGTRRSQVFRLHGKGRETLFNAHLPSEKLTPGRDQSTLLDHLHDEDLPTVALSTRDEVIPHFADRRCPKDSWGDRRPLRLRQALGVQFRTEHDVPDQERDLIPEKIPKPRARKKRMMKTS
jgi:hypothetical protein